MMNVNKSDMDLGLALGISNQCGVQKIWNNNSGAGVNADARADMTFVATDPLSELVWSPQNGLSLKCADKKPTLLWDVGPSNIVFSPSRESKDEKPISEGNLIASRATCHVDSQIAKCASSPKSPRSIAGPLFGSSTHGHTGTGDNVDEVNWVEKVSVINFNEQEDCNREKVCGSKSIQIGNVAATCETSAGNEDRRTADFLPLLANGPIPGMEKSKLLCEKLEEDRITNCGGKTEDNIASSRMRLDFDIGLPSKIHNVKQCEPLEKRKDKMKANGSTSVAFLEKMEATAENDVQHLITKDAYWQNEERVERGESVQGEASSSDSRICLYQRKGKEIDKNEISNNEDNSRESMESCNSANLFLKGKRQWSFDQHLIFGNKRIKKQIQESPLTTPIVKQDSSFMNWISNMVRGLGKSNQEEGHSLALTIGHPSHEYENCDQKIGFCNKTCEFESTKMGFQNIFQSIYSPGTKAQEKGIQIENCSKALVLADKTCEASDNLKKTPFGYDEGTSTHVYENKTLSNLAETEVKNGFSSFDSSRGVKSAKGNSLDLFPESKTINNMGNTSDPLGSLWITRFCPKPPCTMLNSNQSKQGTSSDDAVNVVSKEFQNYKKIVGLTYKKAVGVSSSESLKGPEEMASVFARRLDALNHIIPTVFGDNGSHLKKTCLFCGKTGHGLRDCTEIKENELEGLLGNISSYDGVVKETPCLCIKCLQLDHWAATCPWTSRVQLGTTGNKRCFSMLEMKESQSEVGGNLRNHRMDKLTEEQVTPWAKFVGKQISDVPKGMFDTIRGLRLSRTDILKWTNSHISVAHLDGFFLRLRLAKWEEGLGGAGYYVACITGTQGEKPSKSSKNPIRVSVGGVECLVASQYVSNCDFLEDELMAWWHKTSQSGRIPMEEDLKSKLEERKKLGL